MRADGSPASNDPIALGDLILNRKVRVGIGGAVDGDELAHPGHARRERDAEAVRHVVGGVQFVDGAGLALVPNLLKRPPRNLLVVCG